jgi:hypothetical protein
MKWIKIEDELPPAQSKVIAFYKNRQGMGRVVMAEYIPRFTVMAEDYFDADAEGNTEWSDDGEKEYVAESWHELIDNWCDFSGFEIVEGKVTHWMPKPLPPVEG